MRLNHLILFPLLALAACVPSKPEPVPQPKPQPVPPPVVVAPQPVRPAGDWIDWPIEPGTWVYRTDTRGSLALFGPAGANATVTLRCDKARARIFLSISSISQSGALTVRTS